MTTGVALLIAPPRVGLSGLDAALEMLHCYCDVSHGVWRDSPQSGAISSLTEYLSRLERGHGLVHIGRGAVQIVDQLCLSRPSRACEWYHVTEEVWRRLPRSEKPIQF
jgi:hypothetical protein